MKLAPLIAGLFLLGSGSGQAAQTQPRFLTNQSLKGSTAKPSRTPQVTQRPQANTTVGSFLSPQQRFRANENENPRTIQTNSGPLFLVGMPPGANAPETSPSLKGNKQNANLTRHEKLNAANGLIKRRFPALRNEVRASVQPSGLVVAQGKVPNLGDKLAVSAALLDIPGGTAVLNAITVQPPRRSDRAIQQDVERLLARDPELPDVRVRVNRQVVYFPPGSVPDLFVTEAVQKVARIPGVADVLVGPLS